MASEAQVEANRVNAQKSTGPRTPEGKAAVSQNAVKHGLLAERVVIKDEDPGEFEFYRRSLLAELCPVGDYETILAERAASLAWRLRRAERLQAEALDTLVAQRAWEKHVMDFADGATPKWMKAVLKPPDHGQTVLGRALVHDCANHRVLERMGLYEQRIERSFLRTMSELQKQQVLRQAEPAHADKSEARNPESETNPNDRNSNDRNDDGVVRSASGAHPTKTGSVGTAHPACSTENNEAEGFCQTKPIGRAGVVDMKAVVR